MIVKISAIVQLANLRVHPTWLQNFDSSVLALQHQVTTYSTLFTFYSNGIMEDKYKNWKRISSSRFTIAEC